MIFKEHPNRSWLVTGIVLGIGLVIILFAALPFLKVSGFVKALLIILALVAAGYPVVKHIFNRSNKKSSFEQRHGRKLK